MKPALAFLTCALLLLGNAAPVAADHWAAPTPVLGIIDAGRQATAARRAGATWDRALFLWQEIQPNSASDWQLDAYLDQSHLRPTLAAGIPIVGVVQGTPGWAAKDRRDGAAGVPSGLDLPPDDPRNTFGQFMMRLARTYKGSITSWVLWNEPDFLPGESGSWWTWSGNASDFANLLKTGYRAIKLVDPSATVVFPATTYFADAVHGRELFLSRVLHELNTDPQSPANGYFFDTVGVNLYCSLDAIYRVHGVYSAILSQYQLKKPLWLTETNCPVYNDASVPEPASGRITTDEQSAFLLEAIALARAAGFQRIGWYSMVDHDPSSGIVDRWGLLRADGSTRPAFRAFQVASEYLGGPDAAAYLAPLGTPTANGWPVTRVVVDDATARKRVQILWRTNDGPSLVQVESFGTSAQLFDPLGFGSNVTRTDSGWQVTLPPPRVAQPSDPPGFQSAGYPVLLVEDGVPLTGPERTEAPRVSSPVMALAPATPPVAAVGAIISAPPRAASAGDSRGAPPSAASLAAPIQPGASLVLSVGNPQPNDLLPRGKYVMQGQAFDRAATSGSGVDKVTVFVDDRDSGGQLVGNADLGNTSASGFTVAADLSHIAGGHTLFVYARSAVTGRETTVSFPVTVR